MTIPPEDRERARRALRVLGEGEKRGDVDFDKLSVNDWAVYHRLWAEVRDTLIGKSDASAALTPEDVTEALRILLDGN